MPDQTPNSTLKEAREAKGLTLEIVHEATKIPMDALKAIEQGYSVKLLTPFYYKGFVKIYAEFLGVDPTEALKSYNADKSDPVVQPAFKKKVVAAKPAPEKNEALESLQESLTSIWSPKNKKILLRLIAFVIGAFLLFKMVGCTVNAIKNRPVKPKDVKTKAVEKTTAPAATEKSAEKTVKAESASQKAELGVRATKDTWIQVKADGKTVFAMTMRKGTMETWSAANTIELSGKNINELDYEVNGKHIGALGSGERQAKKIVITKDGLTVKK